MESQPRIPQAHDICISCITRKFKGAINDSRLAINIINLHPPCRRGCFPAAELSTSALCGLLGVAGMRPVHAPHARSAVHPPPRIDLCGDRERAPLAASPRNNSSLMPVPPENERWLLEAKEMDVERDEAHSTRSSSTMPPRLPPESPQCSTHGKSQACTLMLHTSAIYTSLLHACTACTSDNPVTLAAGTWVLLPEQHKNR